MRHREAIRDILRVGLRIILELSVLFLVTCSQLLIGDLVSWIPIGRQDLMMFKRSLC